MHQSQASSFLPKGKRSPGSLTGLVKIHLAANKTRQEIADHLSVPLSTINNTITRLKNNGDIPMDAVFK